jgi:4-amino-4-deoxy-L-arabinose transferase-like glycosyltransferase
MRLTRALKIIHSPVWMVLVGLVARVLYIVVAHSYHFGLSHWSTFEMANLAYSLATGHGFSSPFGGDTGPSAWTPPLYPWLISLAFRTFGMCSDGAAFAVLVFNSVFSALTSWIIYRIAHRIFNETVAVWSGWVWALLPYAIYWSVSWIWETTLSAFLLSLLFMLTLEMEDDDRLWSWCGYGLLWGVAGLTNTSVLSWLPFSGCWLAYQLHRRGKHTVVPVLLSAVIFWLTLMPWLARNYSVFGEPVFVRGDLGSELRVGNNPLAKGWWVSTYHPGNNSFLYERYKQMGERDFDNEQGDQAKDWIAQNPKTFVGLCFHRLIYFWAGIPRPGLENIRNLLFLASSLLAIGGLLLAFKRRVQGVFLFATLLGFYPLIYYFTFPTPRYRHAIDPELAILAVFLISSFSGFQRRRQPAGMSGHDATAAEAPALASRLLRWMATNVAFLILLVAIFLAIAVLTVWNNNYSLHRTSRAEFSSQLDHAIDTSTQWIVRHPEIQGNPPLMFMVGNMAVMSDDPRLHSFIESYLASNRVRVPGRPITWYYAHWVDPSVPVPLIPLWEAAYLGWQDRWFAFATAPDRVELTPADRADLFSPTNYSWGVRLHLQLIALDIYRHFNGPSADLDSAINPVSKGVARDQYWDARVNDAYYQRNAYILAAGKPDLIRARWIERMQDYQHPDGSWSYCWYGWCRGVLEFSLGKGDPGHSTVMATWALYMLKYRYPQWIEQHYR